MLLPQKLPTGAYPVFPKHSQEGVSLKEDSVVVKILPQFGRQQSLLVCVNVCPPQASYEILRKAMKRLSSLAAHSWIAIVLVCIWTGFSKDSVPVNSPDTVPANSQEWKFVSFPDFFNFDIPEPWPQWEPAIDWFLQQVHRENPDFVLVAGDLVDGHWWDSEKCIEHMGAVYYEGWKRRFARWGLKYYVAVGDHELGDDPWPSNKVSLIPHFERVFAQHMNMPDNGPKSKKGLAYYVRHKNLLLVTVETFEITNGQVRIDVGPDQLGWLKQVFAQHSDATFKVVQGHVPIIGKPRGRSTSYLMITNASQNPFWKFMVEASVDLYLCGEFHAVTCTESNGIWQIVHGSSWGRDEVETMDYLVCRVSTNELHLEMKSFRLVSSGQYMWNLNKPKGPREKVEIPHETRQRGPTTIGTLTIRKSTNGKEYLNRTGCFAENR